MAKHANTPQDWRELAGRDLGAAEYLVTMRPVPTEIVCFLCQQAAEKYLKGYLTAQTSKEPPYTHDVALLCKRCVEIEPEFSTITVACAVLVEFGVRPRYDAGLDVSDADMRTALNYARRVRDFVREKFPEMFAGAPPEDAGAGDSLREGHGSVS